MLLARPPEQQLELVRNTARPIVDLVEKGYEVIIGHGNGPQVGMINLAMEFSANKGGGTPFMPFPECGAMTQGYIGYHLQQAIQQELKSRGMEKECATVVTQVVVDEKDPGFQHPTKPVGSFYTKEEAEKIAEEKGFILVEDAGRGYRRVVPSPIPKRIVELNVVDQLVRAGDIVITVGGGGIPVVETEDGLRGVAAVIDKDRASSLLAQDVRADRLIILTAVDAVCVNYNKPDQKELSSMTIAECEKYIAEGQFAPGSMLPKVESCMEFVKNNDHGGNRAHHFLARAADAFEGKTGTVITLVSSCPVSHLPAKSEQNFKRGVQIMSKKTKRSISTFAILSPLCSLCRSSRGSQRARPTPVRTARSPKSSAPPPATSSWLPSTVGQTQLTLSRLCSASARSLPS